MHLGLSGGMHVGSLCLLQCHRSTMNFTFSRKIFAPMLLCILVAPVIIVLYTKAKFSSNHYLCTSVVLFLIVTE